MKTVFEFFLLTWFNGYLVLGVYHTCPVDKYTWEFGDVCIQAHYNTLDWDDARAYCRKLGGDLLEVRSSEMQLSVQNHLKATGKSPAGYWIGATDRQHEDRWEWLHGDRKMQFSNWEQGQGPGQSGFFFSDGSLEDCAMMRPDAGYKWHDGPCAGGFAFHYAYLCEFQIVRLSTITTKQTMKPRSSILMSTLQPTKQTKSPSSLMTSTILPASISSSPSTQAASMSSGSSKQMSTTASSVTTKPTSSSTMPTVTSTQTSQVTSTAMPASASSTKSASTSSSSMSSHKSTAVPSSTSTPKPTTTTTASPSSMSSNKSTAVPTSTSTPKPTTTTTATGVIIGG